jgi:hypothetical protein
MTKRDYIKIAKVLRDSKPMQFTAYTGNLTTDAMKESVNFGAHAQWAADVIHISEMLAEDNPNFIEDLFLAACGAILRPDGAMYLMNWERGVIR